MRAAEQYYRAMYRGSTASWNLRDLHMFETLQTLMEHRGAGAKAVVSHYFQAVLAEQFDAFVWIEKTHAVSPLPAPELMEHEEDTFPFGI